MDSDAPGDPEVTSLDGTSLGRRLMRLGLPDTAAGLAAVVGASSPGTAVEGSLPTLPRYYTAGEDAAAALVYDRGQGEQGAEAAVVEERSEPKAPAEVPPEFRGLIGKRVGNFVLSSVLGQGGMGGVLLAEHPALGKQVAVKFLSRMLASMPEMSARFLEEARSAASLQHPNIVDILDFGELDGQPYYVMEHLVGSDLSKVLGRRKRLSPGEVAEYLKQIGSALEVAHARGIVHRDLKPANVFVVDGSPLRVKLLDFGIAKVMDSREGAALTQSGQVMGTPSHMAPEQAMGSDREIGAQTDLYSLGVILYEMLTGRPLYAHESPVVVMMMHIRDPFTPIRQVAPEVPEAVARVVERCLAKSPERRPPSARELTQAFVDALRTKGGRPRPRSRMRPRPRPRSRMRPRPHRRPPLASPSRPPLPPPRLPPPPRPTRRRSTRSSQGCRRRATSRRS